MEEKKKPDDIVIENSVGKTKVSYVDNDDTVGETLLLYVDSCASSMMLKGMLPDQGEHFLTEEEQNSDVNNPGYQFGIPAVALIGVAWDKDGNKIESAWGGQEDAVMMIIPDIETRMNLVGNILASVLDEGRLSVGLKMIHMLVETRYREEEPPPAAIAQALIDANTINGISTYRGDDDNNMEPLTPSKEALDIMFGRKSKED